MEFPAVRQFAAGIDRQGIVEREFLSAFCQSGLGRDSTLGAVAVAPATHHIEVFERKSGRIHLGVTSRAGFQFTMLIELLSDRDGAADVGVDRRDAWRRWRRLLPEDAFHDPRPA